MLSKVSETNWWAYAAAQHGAAWPSLHACFGVLVRPALIGLQTSWRQRGSGSFSKWLASGAKANISSMAFWARPAGASRPIDGGRSDAVIAKTLESMPQALLERALPVARGSRSGADRRLEHLAGLGLQPR